MKALNLERVPSDRWVIQLPSPSGVRLGDVLSFDGSRVIVSGSVSMYSFDPDIGSFWQVDWLKGVPARRDAPFDVVIESSG